MSLQLKLPITRAVVLAAGITRAVCVFVLQVVLLLFKFVPVVDSAVYRLISIKPIFITALMSRLLVLIVTLREFRFGLLRVQSILGGCWQRHAILRLDGVGSQRGRIAGFWHGRSSFVLTGGLG